MAGTVQLERAGDIALLRVENPPVNALSHGVRQGLVAALAALAADPALRAAVLLGSGATFIAGGDIREFDAPLQPPEVQEICALLEASPKPVVAALHGTPLGGGLEIAIACAARVMAPDAITGFPEVSLGILPGAGGAQRAPHLIGARAALDLVSSGRRIGADEALRLGLVDAIATDWMDAAIAHARALADAGTWRRTGDLPITDRDPAALAASLAAIKAAAGDFAAPGHAAQAVLDALDRPVAAAIRHTRAIRGDFLAGAEPRALRLLFFAERQAARLPDGTAAPRLHRIGLCGPDRAALVAPLAAAGLDLLLLGTGEADCAAAAAVLGAHEFPLRHAADPASLAACDLVLDAGPGGESRRDRLRLLMRHLPPTTPIVVRDGGTELEGLARLLRAPARLLACALPGGDLLECIAGGATSPAAMAALLALARRCRLQAVQAAAPGGIAARLRAAAAGHAGEAAHAALLVEALRLIEAGIVRQPGDIDVVAVHALGCKRHHGGPIFQADEIGAAEMLRRAQALFEAATLPRLLHDIAAAGKAFRAIMA